MKQWHALYALLYSYFYPEHVKIPKVYDLVTQNVFWKETSIIRGLHNVANGATDQFSCKIVIWLNNQY